MWQTSVTGPNQYLKSIDDANVSEVIANGRKVLGRRCVIVAHPAADKTLLRHCDIVADENQISDVLRTVSDARFVVLCGPRAMAETADISCPVSTVTIPYRDIDNSQSQCRSWKQQLKIAKRVKIAEIAAPGNHPLVIMPCA